MECTQKIIHFHLFELFWVPAVTQERLLRCWGTHIAVREDMEFKRADTQKCGAAVCVYEDGAGGSWAVQGRAGPGLRGGPTQRRGQRKWKKVKAGEEVSGKGKRGGGGRQAGATESYRTPSMTALYRYRAYPAI